MENLHSMIQSFMRMKPTKYAHGDMTEHANIGTHLNTYAKNINATSRIYHIQASNMDLIQKY